jgi:release factor glutamine methyltransferase
MTSANSTLSGHTNVPENLREFYRSCEQELEQGLRTLPDKPEENVATTLAALWHAAHGKPLGAKRAGEASLPQLDESAITRLRELIRRRIEGTPLAHLTGRQEFMGIELIASAEALIPREETALLGHAALTCLEDILQAQESAIVIDVCTGSGNLALALAANAPRARVWAADLSTDAIALGRRNCEFLKLGDRVEFRDGDLMAPFDTDQFHGTVDLIVCNPPYISSGKLEGMPDEIIGHEPRLAFDGGPLGIRILQRLISEAPRFLRPMGWLAFEVGLGQGRGVRRRMEQQGRYIEIREVLDGDGQVRALLGRSAGGL